MVPTLCPSVKLNSVGGFISDLYESSLHVLWPKGKIDKFLAADSGVGRDAIGSGVL